MRGSVVMRGLTRRKAGQGWWRRFRRDRSGAAAVEFAVVAPPVFMLIFAIFEISSMTLKSVILQGGLEEGARQLRTGAIQALDEPSQQMQAFEDAVCGEFFALVSCSDMIYDVRTYSSFGGVSLDDLALGSDGMPDSSDIKFEPGAAEQISVIKVYMRVEFTTPFLGKLFNDEHNSRLLTYSAVVMGEPWD